VGYKQNAVIFIFRIFYTEKLVEPFYPVQWENWSIDVLFIRLFSPRDGVFRESIRMDNMWEIQNESFDAT
jgi:hypothetical protein